MKLHHVCRTALAIFFLAGTSLDAGPSDSIDRPFTAIEKSDSGYDSPLHPSEFRNFPRATYRALKNDYEFLMGERFYGAVHPDRFVDLPAYFFGPHEARSRVILAYTKNQKYPIYLIIGAGISESAAEALGMHGLMHVVYTPVGVFNEFPVVRVLNEYHAGAAPRSGEKTSTFTTVLPEIMKYYPLKPGMKWTVKIGSSVRIIDYEIGEVESQWARGVKRETVPNNPSLGKQIGLTIQYDENSIKSIEEFTDASGASVKKRETILQGPLKAGTRWEIVVDQEKRLREIVGINDTVNANGKDYRDVIVVREETLGADTGINFYAITYLFYAKDTGFIGCKVDSADSKDKLRTYTRIDEWYMLRSE